MPKVTSPYLCSGSGPIFIKLVRVEFWTRAEHFLDLLSDLSVKAYQNP